MPIVRVEKVENYSVINNYFINDANLSWKAKGLLTYLLSKPNDWQVYVEHLKNISADGKESTASGIKELIEAGYIVRDTVRNDRGQLNGFNYVVYEHPANRYAIVKEVLPETENPSPVNSETENPALLNTDVNQILTEQNKKLDIPESYRFIWKLWTEYKLSQHRFRYKTSSSEQIALDNLVSLSNNNPVEAERLVKRAIANGWKGIYSDARTAPPSIPPAPPRPKIWTGPADASPEMTPEEKAEQMRIIAEYEARKGVKHGA